MKEIRIFIASSKELLPERNYLSYLTLVLEDDFRKRGFRVRLSKWEYVDPKMTEKRTEDRYLDEMYVCDAALVLFRDKAGKYTREELDKAIAAERAGTTRLKAHEILFYANAAPDSDAARLRSSLPESDCRIWSNQDELREHFLTLIDRVEQCGKLIEAPSDRNERKITAFLAADDELSAERDAFADTVLNVNDLLELAHRNLRVAIRFYDPGHEEDILNACEMGLAIYGTNCRVFGKNEIEHIYERVKDGSQNPKRFYVFFRDLDTTTEKTLDDAFRTFRNDFVTKWGHFTCQFGDANALRLSFLLSLERYAGEGIETYSTVDAPSSVFVGRDEEIKRLLAFLEQGFEKYSCGRIPVVTGAGGTGKSELVRQYASQRRVGFPGGVFQVDMEKVSSVDEAFLRLLDRTSNNGIKVADCLGLGQDGESGSGQENDGTSRKITGADVRDAILRRARTSGPILLFLDNVEDCEIFEKGASQFFPAGFSERVKVNVIATARVFEADSEDGSVVEFPLGDLTSEAAMELLLSEHPAETGEEKQAAAHVAQLLGYRALFLRRVPAIIDTKNFKKAKMICRSYASLAKALEKDTLTTISLTGKVDELHLPGKLWDLTRESLSECLLGDAAVQLIRLAAHFPADGFPKAVLQHLWDTEVFPNCGNEEMSAVEAFDFVLDMGRSYNIFQSTDPVRIHRLDRAAILGELDEAKNAEIVDAIGRSLAGYVGASPELWLSLAELNPGILPRIPDCIVNGRFSGGKYINSFRAALLSAIPAYADQCPWEKLDGREWTELLSRNPEFADRCPWEKLQTNDWENLVEAQPQFADKCPWDTFDGLAWALLLRKQPQFADRCPWDASVGFAWALLLREQPQLAGRCPWDKLQSFAWAKLLGAQPQFADRCPWDELKSSDWANLLGAQPQFAVKCPWEKLTGGDWATLLSRNLEFADKCPLDKLDGKDWVKLLILKPEFAAKCPWEKLDGTRWVILLTQQPQFADRCPWEKLEGYDWADLLTQRPEFTAKCPLEKLTGWDWAGLLTRQPQFAIICPWEKLNLELDESEWDYLIDEQPQFADRRPQKN